MSIHIGEIIEKRVKASGMGVTEFAKRINYTRSNVYAIFKNETIDTGVLMKIGEVLGENLFKHFVDDPKLDELQKISNILQQTVNSYKMDK
jgi:plasmid maintenance system antidote protein VapI